MEYHNQRSLDTNMQFSFNTDQTPRKLPSSHRSRNKLDTVGEGAIRPLGLTET